MLGFWQQLANNSQAVLKPQGNKADAGWFPLASISSALNEASADVAVYFLTTYLRAC